MARRAEIVSLINAASSEADLGLRFAEELCEVFDAEVAFVAEDGGERSEPRTIAAIGLESGRAAQVLGRVEQLGELENSRAVLLSGEDLLGIGARHAVLASFRGEDGRCALVGVARLYEAPLDESDRSLVQAVTLAVGHALERFWANDGRDRAASQQAALVRAAKSMGRSLEIKEVMQTLSEEVQRALDCYCVAAFLGNEVDGYVAMGAAGLDEDFLGYRMTPGTGLGGRAVRAGRVLVTHRYREEGLAPTDAAVPQINEIRSCVAAPLHWDDEFRAFVSAGFSTPDPIATRDVALMEGFAELAGLACSNAERHARVQTAAQVDGLTGCLNRDALEGRLALSIANSRRESEPLSLALIDLDRFKAINDVFGHPSGDAVLRKVGAALRSSLRGGDMVARYGGDEFALILRNSTERQAQPVIDRVRSAIRSLDVPGGKVTACVGVAEHVAGESSAALVVRADEALRDAKMSAGPGLVRRAGRPDGAVRSRGDESAAWYRDRWRAVAGDIGLAVARSNDVYEGAALCANELHDMLELCSCSVMKLGAKGELETIAAAGAEPPDCEGEDGRGAVELALNEKRAIIGRRVAAKRNGERAAAVSGAGERAGEVAVPLLVNGRSWGAIRILGSTDQFNETDADLVTAVAEHLSATIHTSDLYERLSQSMIGTAEALAAALEAKDSYTADHARSIAELAVEVGRELDLPESVIDDLRYAGVFHDLGKIALPDSLLNKPGPLSDAEWELVKRHPTTGAEILAPVPFLYGVRTIVRHAHEHWDGGGYPDGLVGIQIPLGARIILAADAYHAMTSHRPYRKAMTHEQACTELRACSGTQFDPEVAEALLSVLERRGGAAAG